MSSHSCIGRPVSKSVAPSNGRYGFPVLELGEPAGVVQGLHEHLRQLLFLLSTLILGFPAEKIIVFYYCHHSSRYGEIIRKAN